jgi:hypothetical protein
VFEFATGAGVKTNCSSLTICQELRTSVSLQKRKTYSELMLWIGSEVEHFAVRLSSGPSGFLPDGHRATRYSQSKHSNALNTSS